MASYFFYRDHNGYDDYGRIDPEVGPLVMTRTQESKKGWLGQVVIRGEIVREFLTDSEHLAQEEADAHVIARVKNLLK